MDIWIKQNMCNSGRKTRHSTKLRFKKRRLSSRYKTLSVRTAPKSVYSSRVLNISLGHLRRMPYEPRELIEISAIQKHGARKVSIALGKPRRPYIGHHYYHSTHAHLSRACCIATHKGANTELYTHRIVWTYVCTYVLSLSCREHKCFCRLTHRIKDVRPPYFTRIQPHLDRCWVHAFGHHTQNTSTQTSWATAASERRGEGANEGNAKVLFAVGAHAEIVPHVVHMAKPANMRCVLFVCVCVNGAATQTSWTALCASLCPKRVCCVPGSVSFGWQRQLRQRR